MAKDSLGLRLADKVTQYYGSWTFVLFQLTIFALWMIFNGIVLTQGLHFDPWPFILLNLTMSAQAAFSTPVILMASNRQSATDKKDNEILLLKLKEILEVQNETLAQQDKVLEHQNNELAKIESKVGN